MSEGERGGFGRSSWRVARLPGQWRAGYFLAGLVALGATYAATNSVGLQVLVLFTLTFGVLPRLTRRYGRRDEYLAAARGRRLPLGVLAASVVFVVAWGAVVFGGAAALSPGVGPWFLWWLVMWPWTEVTYLLAARRNASSGGNAAQRWSPERPVRDAAVAGLVTAPFIAAITLADHNSATTAVLTAISCGLIVFVIAASAARVARR